MGIIQDTHRRFSIHWKRNKFLTYFMEISFWLTQTMLLYYLLYQVNSGELRFYVFVACLLGFSIYQVIAANVYKRFLEQVIRICLNVYRFIEKVVQTIIITPVKLLIRFLIASILFIGNVLFTIIRYLTMFIFTPVSWVFQTIFRILPKKFQNNLHKLAGFYSTIENICKKWLKYFSFKRR